MSKYVDLFLELAQPNEEGFSRVVNTDEFVGKYAVLWTTNGLDWGRSDGELGKRFIINKTYKYKIGPNGKKGNRVDTIQLCGYESNKFNQTIRKDIKDFYKDKNCVMLGINGDSINTRIEIDHKDGRKDDCRVSNQETQRLEDFQPLCKAANDAKRQICKKCKETDKRWDAKNLRGNPYSFYEGDENYTEELGCKGCYQYDPVEYRKSSVKRITKEASENTTEFIMKKLYGDEE